ncbi:hypothetical protein NHX12_029377 [Muraenolepis orangiensis]|uniref:Uncharacterized protein n=1 Tax=Muraenolepis orangiensis TaxID=630683 RepID=A0A9Q0EHP9_9TELE|nr:hypothetical protein NHX12_029377 [Muraenolepis orangiensis]
MGAFHCAVCRQTFFCGKKHIFGKGHQSRLRVVVKEARRTLRCPQVERFHGANGGRTFWCYCCGEEAERDVTDGNMVVFHGGLLEHMATFKEEVAKALASYVDKEDTVVQQHTDMIQCQERHRLALLQSFIEPEVQKELSNGCQSETPVEQASRPLGPEEQAGPSRGPPGAGGQQAGPSRGPPGAGGQQAGPSRGPPGAGGQQAGPSRGPPGAGGQQAGPSRGPPGAGGQQAGPSRGPPGAGGQQAGPSRGPPGAGGQQAGPSRGPPGAGGQQAGPSRGPPGAGGQQAGPSRGPPGAGGQQAGPSRGPPGAGGQQAGPSRGPPGAGGQQAGQGKGLTFIGNQVQ